MEKITIFTMPRSFTHPFDMLQLNAIKSWLSLKPTPEIILCGKDEGVAEAAAVLNLVHIPDIKLSPSGAPLIDSVFNEARSVAKNSILACVNADIILMQDFLDTLGTVKVSFPHWFMLVGQRWDLNVANYIDFSNNSWEGDLRNDAVLHGELHPGCGIDYFIFEKENGINMFPFPVGRTCWDNWFLDMALQAGIDVVDATEEIFAVHQNHRQYHIAEYMMNRTGEESKLCQELAQKNIASISDAKWKFVQNVLVRK